MTEWDEFKQRLQARVLDDAEARLRLRRPQPLDHAALREIGFIVHGIGKGSRGARPKPLIAGGRSASPPRGAEAGGGGEAGGAVEDGHDGGGA